MGTLGLSRTVAGAAAMAFLVHAPVVAAQDDRREPGAPPDCSFVRCPPAVLHRSAEESLADGSRANTQLARRVDLDGNGREDVVWEVHPHGEENWSAFVMSLSFEGGWRSHVMEVHQGIGLWAYELGAPLTYTGRGLVPVLGSMGEGRGESTLSLWGASEAGPIEAYGRRDEPFVSYALRVIADQVEIRTRRWHARRPRIVLLRRVDASPRLIETSR